MFFEQPSVTTFTRCLDFTDLCFDSTDCFLDYTDFTLISLNYTDNRFISQLGLPKLINKPVLILLAFKYDNSWL